MREGERGKEGRREGERGREREKGRKRGGVSFFLSFFTLQAFCVSAAQN